MWKKKRKMFESLVNPKKAARRPYEMFFIGLLYAALATVLSHWLFATNVVFEKHISVISVFFTVMFSLPFMYYTIKLEEGKDLKIKSELRLLKEHGRALLCFIFLFLGFVVAFAVLYSLPGMDFMTQVETFCQINSVGGEQYESCVENNIQGAVIHEVRKIEGAAVFNHDLESIFMNNIYVLVLCVLFSFFFGAGAIFILAWNASVIGAAIGIFTGKSLEAIPFGLMRYMGHGILEILAYFIAGLAGGIIGVAVIKHDFESEKIKRILLDVLLLLAISIGILFGAALIEVYFVPLFF